MQYPTALRVSSTVFLPSRRSEHRVTRVCCSFFVDCRTRFLGHCPRESRRRHVSTLMLSFRRLSISLQIVGCEQPTSDWNDRFQDSQRLFVLDSPRSVTSWQFHSRGGNRGRCLRIRSGGIAPSVPAGGWMRRNAPFTYVESKYSTS